MMGGSDKKPTLVPFEVSKLTKKVAFMRAVVEQFWVQDLSSKCAKKNNATRQVGHVCLAPAGGPRARDGHHVSVCWARLG